MPVRIRRVARLPAAVLVGAVATLGLAGCSQREAEPGILNQAESAAKLGVTMYVQSLGVVLTQEADADAAVAELRRSYRDPWPKNLVRLTRATVDGRTVSTRAVIYGQATGGVQTGNEVLFAELCIDARGVSGDHPGVTWQQIRCPDTPPSGAPPRAQVRRVLAP